MSDKIFEEWALLTILGGVIAVCGAGINLIEDNIGKVITNIGVGLMFFSAIVMSVIMMCEILAKKFTRKSEATD